MGQENEEDFGHMMLDGGDVAGFLAAYDEKRASISSSIKRSSLAQIIVPNLKVSENEKDEKELLQFRSTPTDPTIIDDEDGSPNNKPTVNGNHITEENKKRNETKKMVGFKRYWGVTLGIASSFFFSLGILIVKLLGHNHPMSIALWRFHGIFLPPIPILLYTILWKRNYVFRAVHPIWKPGKFRMFGFLFLRATAGCFAAVLHYYSMQYMPMPDATVIAFSTPVFVTFLAHILLGEACGLINVVSALVTLMGVTVIVRPPFLTGETEFNIDLLKGGGMALGAMTLSCSVYLLLRLLKGVNYAVVTFFFGMYGTLECAILALILGVFKTPDTSKEWILVGGLACFTFTGQVFATVAAKYEDAGIVALTRSLDVIFTFIWQLVFLDIQPTIFSLVGSLIVILGVSLIVIRKYLHSLPTDHPWRQRFCLLMK